MSSWCTTAQIEKCAFTEAVRGQNSVRVPVLGATALHLESYGELTGSGTGSQTSSPVKATYLGMS